MKRVILLLAMFGCIFFSCKKDKNIPSPDNTSGIVFYKNSVNSNDGLIATYYDTAKAATCYLYGSSNSEGRGNKLNSIVYKFGNNDTLINVIVDDDLRPSIIYLSTSFGVKIDQVCKLDYSVTDSILVSHYSYNWRDNTDSLLAQYITENGTGGRVFYGAKVTSKVDAMFLAAAAATVFIGVVCPVVAGYAVIGLLSTGGPVGFGTAFLGAMTTMGVASSVWADNSKSAQLSTTIPKSFPSPTASIAAIPKPKGTPTHPGGSKPGIAGSWKITSISSEVGEFESIPDYEKDNLIIYKPDNTVTIDEGPTKQFPTDEQQYSRSVLLGDFIIGNDVNTFSGSRFNGSSPDLDIDDAPARTVTLLNATTLKLEWEDSDGKTFWTITYTKQP